MRILTSFQSIILSVAMCVTLAIDSNVPVFAQDREDDDRIYSREEPELCVKPDRFEQSPGGPIDNTAPPGAKGNWTTPGTDAYNVAKEVFDTLTQKYGTSGAFAAGVIGNLAGESQFVPDAAELYDRKNPKQLRNSSGPPPAGRSGGVLRMGMDNPEPVQGMALYSSLSGHGRGPHPGGGGLFQETPMTKFTKSRYWRMLKPQGWAAANQIAFVFEEHFQDRSVWLYMNSRNRKYGAARYGKAPAFPSLEAALSTNDPRKASEAFQVGELRPYKYHPKREDYAAIANSIFNKANVQATPSKWNLGRKRGAGVETGADLSNSVSDQQQLNNQCTDEELITESIGWADNVGSHGMVASGQKWRKDQLPESLKPYLIDLEKLGVTYANCSTWTKWTNTSSRSLNGQCVALSKVAFNNIWKKNGVSGPGWRCNGGVCARNAAAAYRGSTTNVPSKGAVASIPTGSAMCGGALCGHTYIVSHVFQNGDILIIEQNIRGYSGKNNGEVCNWNYRLIPKSKLANATFFTPKDLGYAPDPRLVQTTKLVRSNVGGQTSATTEAWVQTALSKLGRPYSLGANGPNVFDCSSLIWWSRRQHGLKNTPRTANDQMHAVKAAGKFTKNLSELKRGDLMFFGSESRASHVGIYLGNNQMLHASTPSTGVIIRYNVQTKKKFIGGGELP